MKYSVGVNCYNATNFTKLDILDTFPEIKASIAYRHPVTKEKIEGLPADLDLLGKVEVNMWYLRVGLSRLDNADLSMIYPLL